MALVQFTIANADGAIRKSGQQDEHLLPGAGSDILYLGFMGDPKSERVVDGALVPKEPPSLEDRLARRRSVMKLTPRQLFIGMHDASFIPAAEAVAAATSGAMPAAIAAAVENLPPADQADFAITWARMSVIVRGDPMVKVIGQALNLTDAQIDEFFITYAER